MSAPARKASRAPVILAHIRPLLKQPHVLVSAQWLRWLLRACYSKLASFSHARRYVAEWVAAFPSSVHVFRAEDLLDDPRATTRRLFRALGVSSSQWKVTRAQSSYAEMHATSLTRDMGGNRPSAMPMHAWTRARLQEFYAPHNARLATMLHDQRFTWPANRTGSFCTVETPLGGVLDRYCGV